MARFKLHLTILSLFILALIFAGRLPAHSDSSKQPSPRPVFDTAYRSRAGMHKVIVQANDATLRDAILAAGGAVVEDYGSFALMSAPEAAAESVSTQSLDGSAVRDDMNVLMLRAHSFDTTVGDEAYSASSLGALEPADEQLYLVQMIGPVKKDWVRQIAGEAEIVAYVPNNGYLVRATAEAFSRFKQMQSDNRAFVQFAGSYKPEYRIAPEINLDADALVDVTVQVANGKRVGRDIEEIAAVSQAVIAPPQSALNYTNLRLQVSARRLADIARKSNVVWIEPWAKPELHDEKQGMIIAGLYNSNTVNPHGYLAWLASKGITAAPDFSIDFADTGLDKGSLDPAEIHKDFLGAGGASRVVYSRYGAGGDFTGTINDTLGHGTINASIAGGYNDQTGAPYVDGDGYSLGLGIHPFAKLGISKIFDPDYLNPSLTLLVDQMYGAGARISNNSWGTYNNSYTIDSQNYDAMVRDARRSDAGNQELTIIFSSGNKGAGGHLTSPGNAKNTIMVGASENLRPGMDGCGIDSSGGDDINSIIDFSSGGPTTDGRIKPDIVAPGTHIQGARSQDRNFSAGGVCGPGNYPTNQITYTWSSGTSHAAPAVSGAAALLRQFFQQSVGHPPSPAMVKAYLTNAATYLTGTRAGDSLPSPNQGFGLLNLGRVLDQVPRLMVDQDQVLGNTGQVYTLKGRVVDPTKPLRITLAWTDAPGSPAASPTVNNLDLQVDVGGKTYLGNHFSGAFSTEGGSADSLNNLEAVYAPAGAAGEFTVRVVAANIAGDGIPGNNDSTDQDFALIVYNAITSDGSGGGGGGGGGPVDSPPTVNIKYPLGGEHITVGSFLRVLWDASDDKGIQSQRIEFSADGLTYNLLGAVDGKARQFDWRVPSIPTPLARIRVTAVDGVNLPVSSISPGPFEIVNGPPDNVPPTVLVVTPDKHTVVGGGQAMTIQWRETDNVGVVQRLIELSTDNGNSWTRILGISAPSSGVDQKYDWIVPIDMATLKAQVRVTVYDGAGNSATAVSGGNFDVWPLPIITSVTYHDETPAYLEVTGRNFRNDETDIMVDGKALGKIFWQDRYYEGQGMSRKVFSKDKKLFKRIPAKAEVDIVIALPKTGQESPAYTYKRPKTS
ncbi:MAG: S8 family serine peptidase [Blastocatellia bacterium]